MLQTLIQAVSAYYSENKRLFPWRDTPNSYYVFISEVMLQQTQTHRVVPKFEQFIQAFPSMQALALAPLPAVLAAWQGLGYNRRAKFLQQAAQRIMQEHGGVVPESPAELVCLPGIGPATAASIAAFAFNTPTVFIETNIRAVFLHHCFPGQTGISDAELLPLVARGLEGQDPRQWYYALMDYGVMLKKMLPNPSRQSKHHAKQSKFEGSRRQVRGALIRQLTCLGGHALATDLYMHVTGDLQRNLPEDLFFSVAGDLQAEGFVVMHHNEYALAGMQQKPKGQ